MVYIALTDDVFPPNETPTAELKDEDNIIYFSNIDITIKSGEKYNWKVDCVEGLTSKRRHGDVWTFIMSWSNLFCDSVEIQYIKAIITVFYCQS